uniref:Uncharacterized mitochondrial protein AtMg00810-like n=1 Tax=Nicotiana tabacum TaxID=4097 RepID=A0A1S3XCB6_TOBAC|nr:PREDICTED: uncharacterized mitochondrial protein AtMg00810-like [Nicotiana tabacum]
MNQRKYAMELISESGLSGVRTAGTPLKINQKLTSADYDSWITTNAAYEVLKDPSSYQRLVERLLYLTMTRPTLAFAVHVLSQFVHCPKVSHMEATLKVVRYIKDGPGLGLLVPANSTNT